MNPLITPIQLENVCTMPAPEEAGVGVVLTLCGPLRRGWNDEGLAAVMADRE